MKVVGCYSVYNDAEMLQMSIASLSPFVDEIVVVDGAYEGFPHDNPISTDKLLEVLEPFSDKVRLLICEEPLPIKKKMSRFFEVDADWYVHLDADEIAIGNTNAFRMMLRGDLHSYHVSIFDFKNKISERIITTRVFESRPGMEYYRQHWEIWQTKGRAKPRMLYPTSNAITMPSYVFNLVHLHELRSRSRLEKKQAYIEGRRLRGEG